MTLLFENKTFKKLARGYSLTKAYSQNVIVPDLLGKNRAEANIYLQLEEPFIYEEHQGRYLYNLLKLLTSTGNRVALLKRFSFADYRSLGEYAREIFAIDNVISTDKFPDRLDNKILFTNQPFPTKTSNSWKKVVQIDFDISSPHSQHQNWLVMPFGMHPRTHSQAKPKRLDKLRRSPRKMRIFFAGNINPNLYLGSFSQNLFQKFALLARPLIIQTITTHLNHEVVSVDSADKMQRLLQGSYMQKCVLLDKKKLYIPQEKWLEVMAKSDFFLCAPGATIPLCHNLVEAMAVGTIPLINYSDWLIPPLEHLKNCVRFTDEEDLINQVKAVLAMDKSKIQELRRNVIDYYEKHLALNGFLRKIIHDDRERLTMFISTSHKKYLQELEKESVLFG